MGFWLLRCGEGAVPEFLVGFAGGGEFRGIDVGGHSIGDGDEFFGEGDALVGGFLGDVGEIEEGAGINFPGVVDLFEDDAAGGLLRGIVAGDGEDGGLAGDFEGGVLKGFEGDSICELTVPK